MKIFNYFFFISFVFCPLLSFANTSPAPEVSTCQAKVTDLQNEKSTAQKEYNSECKSDNSNSRTCLQLQQRISDLNTQISSQSQKCEGISLEIQQRQAKDAKGSVEKQDKKTQLLGALSTAVGGGLIVEGTSTCGTPAGCNWPVIAMGVAGVGMGVHLITNSKKLKKTSDGLTGAASTCEGDHCTPPPPTPPGGNPPQGPPLGSGFLGAGLPGPPVPDLTNCDPFCPCPGDPAKLPPNCKITKDEDGSPKMTYGPDKDKDGFGDEEVTAADAQKVNRNDPKIQAAVAAAKAPYADMFAELERDGGSEEAADDSGMGGEGFLSGGTTAAGRSAASNPGAGRLRRGKPDDGVDKAIQGLMAQFLKKKKAKKKDGESKLLGDSKIGVAKDNIFLMVHRRYQERRGEDEFLEQQDGNTPLTHNISN